MIKPVKLSIMKKSAFKVVLCILEYAFYAILGIMLAICTLAIACGDGDKGFIALFE